MNPPETRFASVMLVWSLKIAGPRVTTMVSVLEITEPHSTDLVWGLGNHSAPCHSYGLETGKHRAPCDSYGSLNPMLLRWEFSRACADQAGARCLRQRKETVKALGPTRVMSAIHYGGTQKSTEPRVTAMFLTLKITEPRATAMFFTTRSH